MDRPLPPAPHHSRSISHLPQVESTTASPASDTVRPPDLYAPPNNPRRGHSDSIGGGRSRGNSQFVGHQPYGGETWMDFLRQTGSDTSRGRDSDRSYEAFRAAFAPDTARHSGHVGPAVEPRKRRLAAPESPQRRLNHGPTGVHGLVSTDSSRSNASGPSTATIIDLTSPHSSPALVAATQETPGPSSRLEPTGSEIIIPKWQPDSEVQKCPVCDTQFSFWYRKHHCRKCGRVVCANCSPHRITIPRQYIVHPPLLDLSIEEDDDNPRYLLNPALGGGEEVRVCNPCVPDPNFNPPPQIPGQESWQTPNIYQSRPQYGSSSAPFTLLPNPSPEHFARMLPNFSTTHHFGSPNLDTSSSNSRPDIFRGGRINFRDPGSIADLFPPPSMHPHRRSLPTPPHGMNTPISHQRNSASLSARYRGPPFAGPAPLTHNSQPGFIPDRHSLSPPQPRREIPEEDECPICGEELPPKGIDGIETEREKHVQECIATHFSGATPSRNIVPGITDITADGTATSPVNVNTVPPIGVTPLPTPPHRDSASAGGPSRARRMTANRMLVYRATEKDCVGEDGGEQECVICFEEFLVGDEMGRLECLCKFHRGCIKQWWDTKGIGSCPTHQLHE